jgi:hypothetical protein
MPSDLDVNSIVAAANATQNAIDSPSDLAANSSGGTANSIQNAIICLLI